jgi:hypothetical protein
MTDTEMVEYLEYVDNFDDYEYYDEDEDYSSFVCLDCGVNTLFIDEYYMVQNSIWNKHGVDRGMLCIGCLEHRVGRRLEPDDFTDCPLNIGKAIAGSDRLRSRLTH